MRVANILTSLRWKKAGQKQHQGKRQVVWVLPSQTHTQQQMSTPTTPIADHKTVRSPQENTNFQNPVQTEAVGVEQPERESARSIEHQQLKAQTTKEVRRIGWGRKQGIASIKQRYGVSDRSEMSVEQLIDFRDYLRALPNK